MDSLPPSLSIDSIPNRILAFARPQARDFLWPHLDTRKIVAGELIHEAGAPFTHVIFPHEGVISLISETIDGRSVEEASIGLEGFVGFPLIMGGSNAIGRTVVQISGYASWLSIADLNDGFERFECLRKIMLSYSQSLIVQLMHSVACSSLHGAEQRVARWLLHARDRMSGDHFHLTQEALADTLGLRRATVSEACSALSRANTIHYSRGSLEIVDRAALQDHACSCYRAVHDASFLARSGDAAIF